MPLAGVTTNENEQDYPNPVRDSQSVLPYRNSGESQLAVTDVPDDLVLVSSLRRFENKTRVAEGTHTGANNQASILTDSTAAFLDWGVEVGDTVQNITDVSTGGGVISIVTQTTVTFAALTGGTDDDFDTNDVYQINKTVTHQNAAVMSIRKIRIVTDLDVYIDIDGEASSANHLIRLNAGESWNEDGVRVVSRISFINVTNPERPTLRWMVWGI